MMPKWQKWHSRKLRPDAQLPDAQKTLQLLSPVTRMMSKRHLKCAGTGGDEAALFAADLFSNISVCRPAWLAF